MDIKNQIEKQIENPNWDKIKKVTEEKRKLLGGILSEEGLLVIAIKEIYPEFILTVPRATGTEIKGRLISKSKPRFVPIKKDKDKKQAIQDVFIATEDTGVLGLTLWGKSQIDLFKDINQNVAILLKDVKIATQEGEAVLQLFKQSTVEIIEDREVKQLQTMLKPIEINIVKKSKIGTISGIVINKNIREYKSCPMCGKGLSELGYEYLCPTHGAVKHENKVSAEITIDTGKGIVTTTIWAEMIDTFGMPLEFSKIKAICRVYDANHYKREKAAQEVDSDKELIDKQYPKDMRTTCYSYETEKIQGKAQPLKQSKQKVYEEETVSVDDL